MLNLYDSLIINIFPFLPMEYSIIKQYIYKIYEYNDNINYFFLI